MDIEGKKLPETQRPVVNSVLETKTGESFGKEKGLGWGGTSGSRTDTLWGHGTSFPRLLARLGRGTCVFV